MTPMNNKEHLFGKVAVFIDAANIIHCYEDTKWKINISKFRMVWELKAGP